MANKYLVPYGYKDGHHHLREEYKGYMNEVANNGDGTYSIPSIMDPADDAIFYAKDDPTVFMYGKSTGKWYKQ